MFCLRVGLVASSFVSLGVLSRGSKALSMDTFRGAGRTAISLESRDGDKEEEDGMTVPLQLLHLAQPTVAVATLAL